MRLICDTVFTNDVRIVIGFRIALVFAGLGLFVFYGSLWCDLFASNRESYLNSFTDGTITAKLNQLCRVAC